MHFLSFYSDLKPVAGTSTKQIQERFEDQPCEKQTLSSLIRFGDRPSVVVIVADEEDIGNDGGSIEDTPINPTISSIDNQDDIDMKNLKEKWARMVASTLDTHEIK